MTKALIHPLGKSISFGRLSLLGKVLWPMLLAASDNQGRGQAVPDVVKWTVCPNVNEITQAEIAGLLQEMVEQGMICVYQDSRGRPLYQVIRWWEYQSLQWAQRSKYEAPEGWVDRMRYNVKGDGGGYVKENWEEAGGYCEAVEEVPEEEPDTTNPGGNAGANAPEPTTKLNLTETNSKEEKEQPADADAPLPPDGLPDPSELTVKEIQALKLSIEQWRVLQECERNGRNRSTAVRFMRSQLNPTSPAVQVYRGICETTPLDILCVKFADTVGAD